MARICMTLTLIAMAIVSAAGPADAASCAELPRGANGLESDFDGNGYNDLPVGAPREDVGSIVDAGAVQVLYTRDGGGFVPPSRNVRDEVFTQSSPGVPGSSKAGDLFGWTTASGDFDGDGYCDLAIGSPYEPVDGKAQAGRVTVLYGSSGGLTTRGAQTFSQDTPGVRGVAEAGDRFGISLTAGKFGRGHYADLVIGVPYEAVGRAKGSGQVHVLYGSSSGLRTTDDQIYHGDTAGLRGTGEAGDHFGAVLAATDLGKSSVQELLIGVPDEDVDGVEDAGAVQIIYGSADGLTKIDQVWSAATSGIGGAPLTGGRFGFAIATGEFGWGSGVDVAIGSPGAPYTRDATVMANVGRVHVLYGSADGPTTKDRVLLFDGNEGALFGYRLGAGNMATGGGEGTSHLDLLVGAPSSAGNGPHSGTSYLYFGSINGLEGEFSAYMSYEYHDQTRQWNDRWTYGGINIRHFGPDEYTDVATAGIFAEDEWSEPVLTDPGYLEIHPGSNVEEDAWSLSQAGSMLSGSAEDHDEWGRVGSNHWHHGF